MTKPVLEIKGGSLSFGERRLWSGLDIEVQPHEFIAIKIGRAHV